MRCFLVACLVFGSSYLSALPQHVFIIRHGEKPPEGNGLNQQGWERAYALAPFFLLDPFVTQFGSVKDNGALFAQKPGKSSTSSIRPIQTITPLSHASGNPVQSPYRKDDVQSMANLVLNNSNYNGKVIVISWAHQAIASLAAALGVVNPPAYPEDRFDLIYSLTYDASGNVTFCVSLQELMFGDPSTLPVGFPSCP